MPFIIVNGMLFFLHMTILSSNFQDFSNKYNSLMSRIQEIPEAQNKAGEQMAQAKDSFRVLNSAVSATEEARALAVKTLKEDLPQILDENEKTKLPVIEELNEIQKSIATDMDAMYESGKTLILEPVRKALDIVVRLLAA